MALQIRRGTNAERLAITPAEGELIYTTDSKRVYVGDGTTAGGTDLAYGIQNVLADTSPELGGNLDLNGFSILGTGSINIDGTITATGNINLGDGSEDNIAVGGQISSALIPNSDSVYDLGSSALKWREGHFNGLTVNGEVRASAFNGNIIGDDSTLVFDSATNTITADSIVATGSFSAPVFDGELTGSVFADDSTIMLDAINQSLHVPTLQGDKRLFSFGSRAQLELTFDDMVNLDQSYAEIIFSGRTFQGVEGQGAKIVGGKYGIFVQTDFNTGSPGTFTEANTGTINSTGIGYGTYFPQAELDIRGDGLFTGTVEAAAFKGTIAADDSSIIINGVDGSITAPTFVQFGSLTSGERDALAAANGMVIYNTTNNKFEGYQNGGWINLDDGLAAS
jgi:hypothetical protein